jgi:hypothetical protein
LRKTVGSRAGQGDGREWPDPSPAICSSPRPCPPRQRGPIMKPGGLGDSEGGRHQMVMLLS